MLRDLYRVAAIPLLAMFSCAIVHAPRALAADVYTAIPFPSPGAPGNSLELDLYVPSEGTPAINTTILMVHGGSYSSGCRCDFDAMANVLADLGFTVVSPDYTLVTPTSASYPQPISDVFNAIHWVRTEGQTLNLPSKVIICGVSAGSTIAMTAAMAASCTVFNRLPDPIIRGYAIDGAIAVMGRYDLVWNANYGIPQTVIRYIGIPLTTPNWTQTWTQASAITYVDATSPPAFLIHGTNDGLVPYLNSTRLHQRMVQVGAPVHLALVPGGGHDMSILGFNPAMQAQTIATAIHWIDTGSLPIVTGSCCAANYSCTITAAPDCVGVWTADGICWPGSCDPDLGACCSSTGVCTIIDRIQCTDTWLGDDFCDPNPCPQPPPPLGACCALGGTCALTPQPFCPSSWTVNITCQPVNPCPQPSSGSCCSTLGACAATTQALCNARWTLLGVCDPNPCPQPLGACCAADGACTSTAQTDCAATWTILGACSPNPCALPAGACCTSNGSCASTYQTDCPGAWTALTACSPNPCPQPLGACCMGAACAVTLQADCSGVNRRFTSFNAACNPLQSTTTPCCRADFNHNTTIAVSDIFDYLNAWFASSPDCRVSAEPTSAPTIQDVFEYLNAWFGGC